DDAATADDGDPFALDADASPEIALPGWPGWPPPAGTEITPAVFCEGAVAPALFMRDPRCSVAESKADVARNANKPFAGFGRAMERSRAARCIARLASSAAKKRVRLDGEAGKRCIAAAIAAAYDDGPNTFESAACNGYVIGLASAGEPCADPWECSDGLA